MSIDFDFEIKLFSYNTPTAVLLGCYSIKDSYISFYNYLNKILILELADSYLEYWLPKVKIKYPLLLKKGIIEICMDIKKYNKHS